MSYVSITWTEQSQPVRYRRRATYSIGFVDVGGDHFGENGLAADVPNLHGDVNIAGQLDPAHEEVQPDCLFVRAGKLVFTEATYERRLAHCAVT